MAPARFDAVDALRGSAMVWMTIFHFCFDLSHFGYWVQDFRNDPVWIGQRTVIVSLFLFCAGLGQAIAVHQGQGWDRFGRRWLQIAACALLVSAGSFAMFPRSFIYFGVLHAMAVMLPLARVTYGWGRWLWLAGGLASGRWWLERTPHASRAGLPLALRWLAPLGRWSLSYYMLHQPVLIGSLLRWGWWRGVAG